MKRLTNAEKAEIHKELEEAEKAKFKPYENKIAELEKENAELKTKVTALENANRAMVKELDDTTNVGLNILQNVVKNKEELTKAKKLLKKVVADFHNMDCITVHIDKTIAEAEQFLSEVEK